MSSDGRLAFSANDYMAKTPDWAVFGAKEQGFDPAEERFYRKKKNDGSGDADDCDWEDYAERLVFVQKLGRSLHICGQQVGN